MMESKMKHTPEPWSYANGDGHYEGAVVIVGGRMTSRSPLAHIRDICDDAELDARRIVACVNACAGIDTEWLENNGAYAVPVPSLRTLLNQRDELLAAIEGYLPYMPNSTAKNGGACGHSEMLKASDRIKDAFAEIEAQS